jgi:hypothetical protein
MTKHTHTTTTTTTATTYTCDLCESEMPDEGTPLPGMVMEYQPVVSFQWDELPAAQFCARCIDRPISDLVEHFNEAKRRLQELRGRAESQMADLHARPRMGRNG